MLKYEYKKVLAAFTVVCLSTTILSGCSFNNKKVVFSNKLEDSELFKINGECFRSSEGLVFLLAEKNRYESVYGSECWNNVISEDTMESLVKDEVKDGLARLKIACLMAKDNNIKLSKEEKDTAKQCGKNYYNALSKETIEYMNIKEETAIQAFEDYMLEQKVIDKLGKNAKYSEDATPGEIEDAKNEVFLDSYNEYIKNISSEFNDDEWDKYKLSDSVAAVDFYQYISNVS